MTVENAPLTAVLVAAFDLVDELLARRELGLLDSDRERKLVAACDAYAAAHPGVPLPGRRMRG